MGECYKSNFSHKCKMEKVKFFIYPSNASTMKSLSTSPFDREIPARSFYFYPHLIQPLPLASIPHHSMDSWPPDQNWFLQFVPSRLSTEHQGSPASSTPAIWCTTEFLTNPQFSSCLHWPPNQTGLWLSVNTVKVKWIDLFVLWELNCGEAWLWRRRILCLEYRCTSPRITVCLRDLHEWCLLMWS